MKIAFALPAFGLILLGAWSFSTAHKPTPVSTSVTTPEAVVVADAKPELKIWTSTPTVFKGEELILNFAGSNAKYLGVVDPQGHFFYVIYPGEMAEGGLRPLISSEQFENCEKLKIQPSRFAADPYTYGVDQNQPVFKQSGTYTFILGDNLHVDDPQLVSRVTVHYTHNARPAKEQV